MSDSTPNIDQYKGNYYIAPDEVQELRRRIAELEALVANLSESLTGCNENNRKFAKEFRKDQDTIAALEAKVAELEADIAASEIETKDMTEFRDGWVEKYSALMDGLRELVAEMAEFGKEARQCGQYDASDTAGIFGSKLRALLEGEGK